MGRVRHTPPDGVNEPGGRVRTTRKSRVRLPTDSAGGLLHPVGCSIRSAGGLLHPVIRSSDARVHRSSGHPVDLISRHGPASTACHRRRPRTGAAGLRRRTSPGRLWPAAPPACELREQFGRGDRSTCRACCPSTVTPEIRPLFPVRTSFSGTLSSSELALFPSARRTG